MKNIDVWGINIFLISELTNNRPLTVVVYNIFQVSEYVSTILFS